MISKTTLLRLLFISIVCAATLVIGCINSPEYGTSNTMTGSSDLVILEHNPTTGDYGNLIVAGTAENTGSSSLIYAEIRVKFYDKNGALDSTSIDNINDLGPGEKWNFKVMYFGTSSGNVDNYKIAIGSVI